MTRTPIKPVLPRTGVSKLLASRRGVVSVLAMMLLILFGSLVTAMAISSKGNIRAAATQLHVNRALAAAETGLDIAMARLEESAGLFVVSRGTIDSDLGWRLWTGETVEADGVSVLASPSGVDAGGLPDGIADALAQLHNSDANTVVLEGITSSILGNKPIGADDSIYRGGSWLFTPGVYLWEQPDSGAAPPAFQVTYAPLASGTDIRVIVTGFDFAYRSNGMPVTRTIMQDFRIAKRVKQAINSPTRVMIGKNVHVEGDLGARFTDVDFEHGHPMVLRSDFRGIDSDLDDKLDLFYDGVFAHDVDGDNRLRADHPGEAAGLPDEDLEEDEDSQYRDITGDGYIDEFDIFIIHYDKDGDGRVTLSSALKAGTPAASSASEFVDGSGNPIDDDLALLMDSSTPDRNRNGIYGFVDANNNGRWDAGTENLLDFDDTTTTFPDQQLGYRDGYIDALDRYVKVNGRLLFRVQEDAWSSEFEAYASLLQGGVRGNDPTDPSRLFDADEDALPTLDEDSFADSSTGLRGAADGESFARQVADNLGVSESALLTYVETASSGATDGNGTPTPRFLRLDRDNNLDGLPDNWQTAYYERMPFNSPNYADWYYRPVYENMTFYDVQIPVGTNALFINCTFIGATYVRSNNDNSHPHFTTYGRMELDSSDGKPKPDRTRIVWGDDASETLAGLHPTIADGVSDGSNVAIALDEPLDKGDIPLIYVSAFEAEAYASLPEPLVIGGKHITDTRTVANNIRFHGCLFVGSIVSDAPQEYTHVRNKLQFTGSTRFTTKHPDDPDDAALNPEPGDEEELAKSSMLLPNYSVDIGSFNSPPDQSVALRGAVIAGVLDMRGNASIDGALILTYDPEVGVGPLQDFQGNPVGNPAWFNTSIGYFGSEDGDAEAVDPRTLPTVNGTKIVGYDTDGDGVADIGPEETPPSGATAVPFNGYGGIQLRFDPNMVMPDGIEIPLTIDPLMASYQENKL